MQPSILQNKKFRQVSVIAGILIVILLGFLAYREFFTFYLKGTFPGTNRISYNSPFIELRFNKTPHNDYKISFSEDENYISSSEIDGKNIILYVTNLEIDQSYTINLESVTETGGKSISGKSLSFTVQNIPFDQLSEREQEVALRLQNEKDNVLNDPIMSLVPYSTLEFNLGAVLVDEEERPTLRAELLLTGADVRIDRQDAIERYKKAVTTYLTDNDIDPKQYTIEYVIIEPSI